MAKQELKAGTTSFIDTVFITDVNGSPITGLVFNSTGLLAKYVLPGAASVAITLATQTVTGAYSSGGFVEIDATAFPGLYRLDVPNAALAAGNNKSVVSVYGYTGISANCKNEYLLEAVDNQDTIRYGLTALPNAVAGANTGLPVVGTQIPNATAAAAGGLLTFGSSTGQLNPSGGAMNLVANQLFVKKNAALSNFAFPMVDSTGAAVTGLTVSAERRIDSGSYAACANAVAEIGTSGTYSINLAAADLNGVAIIFHFSGTGALDRWITIITQT